MGLLFNSLKDFFLQQGLNRNYYIAYSGGLDSHVLLHLCTAVRLYYPLRLKAVHIHHGLSPHADEWLKHCEKICSHLDIDFVAKKIHAKHKSGESPEEMARDNRYEALAEILEPQATLLTAQHKDDQAETVLLQLFRGAGINGLAAMPSIKTFGKGSHARPLLPFTRNDIQEYAEKHHLQWVDDESNLNTQFTRNFVRHEIMPLLKTRWPSITTTLSRVAAHCSEAMEMLEERVEVTAEPKLSLKKLRPLSAVQQRQLLRQWFMQLKCPLPSALKLKQIQLDFLKAAEDKSPYIQWQDVELRRYDDELYLMKCLPEHDATQTFIWDLQQPLIIPHIGTLSTTQPLNCQVVVRFRQGGETCQLTGRSHHHELKKLFQDWRIPPWERERIPLIYLNDKLIAVVGYFMDTEFAKNGTEFHLSPCVGSRPQGG